MTKSKIYFFCGSQDLYGPEVLEQVAQQTQTIVDQLNQSGDIPLPIVLQPTLKSSEAIYQAFTQAGADDECVGIILWCHTFSPAKMWIKGLNANIKPLLQLNTQANVEIPWDTIDMDFMNLNQAAHGDREFGHILTRMKIARKIVVGHYSDSKFRQQIANWTRACLGAHELKHLKVMRLGDTMRNVAVTEGDKVSAEQVLGVSVNTWPVNELVDLVNVVQDSKIDQLVEQYLQDYEVAPELLPTGAKYQSLRDAAAIEIGLRTMLNQIGAQAFTDTFEDLGALKQLPGVGVQRLMAEGYGFGAEGDWKTAIMVRLANLMGTGRPGGASLMEDYTYDLTPGQETILGAHMLEVSPSLTTKKPRLEIHPLSIGGKADPVRLVFTADPQAEALLVSLSDHGDRFHLVINEVELVEPKFDMPKLPVGRALWRPKPNLQVSAQCWLTTGSSHHTALSTNTNLETWRDLSRILGLDFWIISDQTCPNAFGRAWELGARIK